MTLGCGTFAVEAAWSDVELARLRTSRTDPRLQLAISDDTAVKDELSEIMIEAMRIETASKSRDAETIAMFRFNDEERSRYRDGIGLDETGMSGLKCGQSTYPLDAAKP